MKGHLLCMFVTCTLVVGASASAGLTIESRNTNVAVLSKTGYWSSNSFGNLQSIETDSEYYSHVVNSIASATTNLTATTSASDSVASAQAECTLSSEFASSRTHVSPANGITGFAFGSDARAGAPGTVGNPITEGKIWLNSSVTFFVDNDSEFSLDLSYATGILQNAQGTEVIDFPREAALRSLDGGPSIVQFNNSEVLPVEPITGFLRAGRYTLSINQSVSADPWPTHPVETVNLSGSQVLNLFVTSIPEPGSMLLLSLAAIPFVHRRRKYRRC